MLGIAEVAVVAHYIAQVAARRQVAGGRRKNVALLQIFHVGHGGQALHHRQARTVQPRLSAEVLLVSGPGFQQFGGGEFGVEAEQHAGRGHAGRNHGQRLARSRHGGRGARRHANALDTHVHHVFPLAVGLPAPQRHVFARGLGALVLQHAPGAGGVAQVTRLGHIGQQRVPGQPGVGLYLAGTPRSMSLDQLTIFHHRCRGGGVGHKCRFHPILPHLLSKRSFGRQHRLAGRLGMNCAGKQQGGQRCKSQLCLHKIQNK